MNNPYLDFNTRNVLLVVVATMAAFALVALAVPATFSKFTLAFVFLIGLSLALAFWKFYRSDPEETEAE